MSRWIGCASLLMLAHCGSDKIEPSTYSIEKLKDPDTCGDCHKTHYQEWSGSMHAYAAIDPLFIAMNDRGQREANIGNFCVNCHAPMAIPADGSTVDTKMLQSLSKAQSGVTCYFCHTIDGVKDLHNASLVRNDDTVMRGQYTDPVTNEAHQSRYSDHLNRDLPTSTRACGSCHDIVNGHGANVERTYVEWTESAYPTPLKGSQCAACHMQRRPQELIADGPKVKGVKLRDRFEHTFHAIDKALTPFPEMDAQSKLVDNMLSDSLGAALCVVRTVNTASISVIVDNIKAGHHFPSGASQDRQLWFEINAYLDGTRIFDTGVVPSGTDASSLDDDNLWLLRDCMFDENDNQTHNFWDAATISSNTLRPLSTFDSKLPEFFRSHWIRNFPKPGSTKPVPQFPDRVVLRSWFQPFPYEVFDDFMKDADRLGYSAAQVADMRSRIAPRLMSELEWTAAKAADADNGGFIFTNSADLLPGVSPAAVLQCVTAAALKPTSQATAAARHTNPKCK